MPVLSASQIETFELCPRRWGFRKLDGLPEVQHESAAFGTRVHALLEGWLRDGAPPDVTTKEGRCAAAALPHLPVASRHALQVEDVFFLRTSDNNGDHVATFTGLIDIRWFEDGVAHVHDHKTTGNLKYQKTEEMLRIDTQANLYAAAAMLEYETDFVELTWGYLDRNRPKYAPTKVRLHRHEVEKQIDRINATAKRMLAVIQEGKSAKELDYNNRACEAFGGCPYRDVCNLSQAEKITGYMELDHIRKEGHMSDLLAKMRAKAAAAAAKAPAPAAAAKPLASLMAKRVAAAPAINPPAEEVVDPSKVDPPKPGPGRPPKAVSPGRSLEEEILIAAVQGFCSNSAFAEVPPKTLFEAALEIAGYAKG